MAKIETKQTKASFYMWCFFVCSFVGWIYESIWKSIVADAFVNSGFLYGFYLPIYGFGGLLLILCLKKLTDKQPSNPFLKFIVKPIAMFILITFIVSALEYFASYILELIFHKRWWDYTDHTYHLNGRISLSNSLILGSLGFVFVYILYPFMQWLRPKLTPRLLNTVAIVIAIVMLTDTAFTLLNMFNLI